MEKPEEEFAIYQDIIFKQVVEKGLIPVLEHVVKLGIEVDLEDVLQRFDYDNICLLALGFDPKTLSLFHSLKFQARWHSMI